MTSPAWPYYGIFFLLFLILMPLGAVKYLTISNNKNRQKYSIIAVMISIFCSLIILEVSRHIPRLFTNHRVTVDLNSRSSKDAFNEEKFHRNASTCSIKLHFSNTALSVTVENMLSDRNLPHGWLTNVINLSSSEKQVTNNNIIRSKDVWSKGFNSVCAFDPQSFMSELFAGTHGSEGSVPFDSSFNQFWSSCPCEEVNYVQIKRKLKSINAKRNKLLGIPLMAYQEGRAYILLIHNVNRTQKTIAKNNATSIPVLKMLQIKSFFLLNFTSFHDVIALFKDENAQIMIPTREFLEACFNYLGFFDCFSTNVMSPFKKDINSNIEKIKKVYQQQTQTFQYLQDMLEHEKSSITNTASDSATQALLWLTRALHMMCVFVKNMLTSSSKTFAIPSSSLLEAYTSTLMQHHSWLTQKLFRNGMSFLGDFDDFLSGIITKESLEEMKEAQLSIKDDTVRKQVIEQGLAYAIDMCVVVKEVEKLYVHYDIKQ